METQVFQVFPWEKPSALHWWKNPMGMLKPEATAYIVPAGLRSERLKLKWLE